MSSQAVVPELAPDPAGHLEQVDTSSADLVQEGRYRQVQVQSVASKAHPTQRRVSKDAVTKRLRRPTVSVWNHPSVPGRRR